jgi:hypothetical protein
MADELLSRVLQFLALALMAWGIVVILQIASIVLVQLARLPVDAGPSSLALLGGGWALILVELCIPAMLLPARRG